MSEKTEEQLVCPLCQTTLRPVEDIIAIVEPIDETTPKDKPLDVCLLTACSNRCFCIWSKKALTQPILARLCKEKPLFTLVYARTDKEGFHIMEFAETCWKEHNTKEPVPPMLIVVEIPTGG